MGFYRVSDQDMESPNVEISFAKTDRIQNKALMTIPNIVCGILYIKNILYFISDSFY